MSGLRKKNIKKTNIEKIIFGTLLITIGCAGSRFHNIDLVIRQQNWPKAQQLLEEHLARNPRDGDAHLMLAEVYGESDQVDAMLATLEKVSRLPGRYRDEANYLRKKYWIKNYNQGLNHFSLKDYERAVERFQVAVRIDSGNTDGWQRYGDALFMTARYFEAERAYKRVLDARSDNLTIKNNLAEIYFIQKKYDRAVALCDEILAADAKNMNALMRRAYAYDALDRLEEAERNYRAALELKSSAALLTDLGRMFFRHEQYDRATRCFTEALDHSDDKLVQYRLLGEVSWRRRDFDAMVYWYQQIVNSYPNDLTGWKNLAVAYEALGKTDLLARARQQIDHLNGTN